MDNEQLILGELQKLNFSVGQLSSNVTRNGEETGKLFEKVDHLAAHGCAVGERNTQAINGVEAINVVASWKDNR